MLGNGAAIVDRAAVVEHQHRDLAEWIGVDQISRFVFGFYRHELDGDAGIKRGHAHFGTIG
jgi:hypothetical protein